MHLMSCSPFTFRPTGLARRLAYFGSGTIQRRRSAGLKGGVTNSKPSIGPNWALNLGSPSSTGGLGEARIQGPRPPLLPSARSGVPAARRLAEEGRDGRD